MPFCPLLSPRLLHPSQGPARSFASAGVISSVQFNCLPPPPLRQQAAANAPATIQQLPSCARLARPRGSRKQTRETLLAGATNAAVGRIGLGWRCRCGGGILQGMCMAREGKQVYRSTPIRRSTQELGCLDLFSCLLPTSVQLRRLHAGACRHSSPCMNHMRCSLSTSCLTPAFGVHIGWTTITACEGCMGCAWGDHVGRRWRQGACRQEGKCTCVSPSQLQAHCSGRARASACGPAPFPALLPALGGWHAPPVALHTSAITGGLGSLASLQSSGSE